QYGVQIYTSSGLHSPQLSLPHPECRDRMVNLMAPDTNFALPDFPLFEAIYTARAMRWLKPDPVPSALIEQILNAAIQAPNAGNRQNWLFVVVRDPEQRRRIGAIYQKVSQWVLTRYKNQVKPEWQSQAEYDRMM